MLGLGAGSVGCLVPGSGRLKPGARQQDEEAQLHRAFVAL